MIHVQAVIAHLQQEFIYGYPVLIAYQSTALRGEVGVIFADGWHPIRRDIAAHLAVRWSVVESALGRQMVLFRLTERSP